MLTEMKASISCWAERAREKTKSPSGATDEPKIKKIYSGIIARK